MKKFLLLLSGFALSIGLSAQTVVYHENFEAPSNGDSVTSSGAMAWSINSRLAAGGAQCDSNYVVAGDSSFLTTGYFDCSAYSNVTLSFSHICKIELLDAGEVYVSVNNGPWIKLTGTQYINPGSSQFVTMGNKFNANTYPVDWLSTQNSIKPTNTWWRNEQFDISALAGNQSNIRIRFKLSDGNGNGANLNHGWFLDNIMITCALSELIPPTVTYKPPVLQDTVFSTGPFNIYAWIKDPSGIDTAWVTYNVNGGSNMSVPMTWVSDSTYVGTIPSYSWNNTINYFVTAQDNSLAHNTTVAAGHHFYIKMGPTVVTIGTGTTAASYPYYTVYEDSRTNMLYTAADIIAAGGAAGLITSLALDVTAVGSPVMSGFSVQMQNYSPSTLTGFVTTGWTNVYSGTYTPAGTGWQTITLATPFYWNGTSNLLINICYDNASWSSSSTVNSTAATGRVWHYHTDGATGCSMTGGSLQTTIPNIQLSFPPNTNTNDAGVTAITAPVGTIVGSGPHAVSVTMKNYAVDTLTSVTLKYSVDGVYRDSLDWSGILLPGVSTAAFDIDTTTFGIGMHTLKAWVLNPNDSIDQNHANDTASGFFFLCDSLLNGTYTVGSGGDFLNFASVIGTLNNCGIGGSVTFLVNSGTYNEQLVFSPISGSSMVNTITFKPNVGATVTIGGTYTTSTIKFNGADNIIFDGSNNGTTSRNMTITNASTAASTAAVWLASAGMGAGCSNITIKNCNISTGSRTATTYGICAAGATIGSAGSDNDFLTVQNNSITKSYYGIWINGVASTGIDNDIQIISNVIGSNIATDYIGFTGIHILQSTNVTISSNLVKNIIGTITNPIGINVSTGVTNAGVLKNTITGIRYTAVSGYGASGIEINTGAASSNILVANNMITDIIADGTISYTYMPRGIGIDGTTNGVSIYYNSVYMSGDASNGTSTYQANFGCLVVNTSATGLNVRNNIFRNDMSKTSVAASRAYAVYSFAANTAYTNINYNDYYVSGTQTVLGFLGSACATLANWQTATAQDANSVNVDPVFTSTTNLHTFALSVNNIGTPIATVTDDIDGDVRNATTPDLGADEFDPLSDDIGLIAILEPVDGCGYTASEPVTITIKNFASDTITTAEMFFQLDGGTVVHETFNGSIPSDSTYDYTFTATVDLSLPGTYSLITWVELVGDGNHLNDTLSEVFYSGYDFSIGPYTMGFESSENFTDWSVLNVNSDAETWTLPWAGTPHSGSRSVRYYNSTAAAGDEWLFSRCFTFEANQTYEISYWYRVDNATYPQSVNLLVGNNTTPAAMTTTLVTNAAMNNTVYQKATVTYLAPAFGTYYFGWHAYSAANNNYHAYIDDINIDLIPDQEATALDLLTPEEGCGLSSAEPVTLQIINSGAQPITGNLTAYYSANGSVPVGEAVSDTIAVGDTIDYLFTAGLDMTTLTGDSLFNITAWVVLTGDPFAYNDTAFNAVLSRYSPPSPTVTADTVPYGGIAVLSASSPYTVSWWDSISGGAMLGTGLTYTTPQLYATTVYYAQAMNGAGDQTWTFDTGLEGWTPSSPCSSPVTWAWNSDAGHGTAFAVNYSTNSSQVLTSPVINVVGSSTVNLSYLHRFGTEACCDHGYVAYRLDGGAWVQFMPTVGAYTGLDGQYNEPFWNSCASSANMSLYYGTAAYATHSGPISVAGHSTLEIAFVFTTDGSGIVDGWYLDEVNLSGLVACMSARVPDTAYVMLMEYEAGMLEMPDPVGGCSYGPEMVTVSLRNNGDSTITTFNASYQANSAPVVNEVVNVTILPGDTLDYTFATLLDPGLTVLNQDTTIMITAWVQLTGDTYSINDTISKEVEFMYSPPDPIVSNVNIPYGTSTTLSAISADTLEWFNVPVGGTALSQGTYTTPVLYGTTIYYVQATTNAPGFYMNSLLTSNSAVVDHDAVSGDDRGGIAVTEDYYYYMGDVSGVRLDMPNLTNPTAVTRRDGIFSDLSGSGTLYTLWNGTIGPVGTSLSSAYTVSSIQQLNNDLTLGTTNIPLSQNIVLGSGSNSAVFSGGGFAILYNNASGTPANTWYLIEIPSGNVTVLGTYTFTATIAENWARWGIAELMNDDYCVTYVGSSTEIRRLNLSTGVVSTVGTFTSLSDMACITYAPWYNRWYFHHEGSSQFGGTSETAGYADALATMNQGCTSARLADTVFVTSSPDCDMSVEVIYKPVSGVELTASEQVAVRVRNFGTDTSTNIPINFSIDGGAPVTEIIPGPIAPNDTLFYVFTNTADLSAIGSFTFDVFTTYACDTITVNDTVTVIINNDPLVYCTSIPSYPNDEEIFNVTIDGATVIQDCFTVAPGPGSMLHQYANYMTLGPLTTLSTGTTVYFSIDQDECDGATYYDNGIAMWIDFNHDGDFEDAGEQVYVEATTTTGPRTINGTFVVPYTPYSGATGLRVIVAEGYSGSSLQPCMTYGYGETEDYLVYLAPQIPIDAGVAAFNSPLLTEVEGTTIAVEVMVRNFGSDTIHNSSNMTVSYSHNGGPVQSIAWSGGDILPTESDTAILPSITVLPGYNEICAWTELVGDSNAFNDTLCFTFYGEPNNDAGVSAILQPSVLNGFEGASVNVQVTINNYGSDTLTAFPVSYAINGVITSTENWAGSLLPGSSATFGFTTPYITPAGAYELCAFTGLLTDGDHTNDTTCVTPYGLFSSTLPYYDNFDGTVSWTQENNGLNSKWELGTPTYGTTNSVHSAPNAWDVNLTSVYTSSCQALLYTQNFDFTGAVNAKLSFWLNVDVEPCCDGLTLQYSTDSSVTWNTLGTVGDPLAVNWYTTSTGGYPSWVTSGGWAKVEYTLTALSNLPSVRFRFIFHADGSIEYSGASVDDFSITIPSPIDAGVEMIKAPVVQAPAGSMKTVRVLVRNFGMDTLTSIPISYTVNGGTPVTATWTGQLIPNDTMTYTFAQQLAVPGGMFELCAYTGVSGDGDSLNDTTCINVTGVVTFVVPWSDDMESTVYWFGDGGNASWEWGVPAATTINAPHSPTHCWATNLDGYYSNSSLDMLYTPFFLFTQVNSATLDFWHWYQIETSVDGGKIEYSVNSGSTWITLGYVGDPAATNWYTHNIGGSPYWSGNSSGWVHSTYDLSTISSIVNATNPVQFRFKFMSSASNNSFDGWAIDDFAIIAPPIPKDAGVIAIVTPSGSTITGTAVSVGVTLENFGTDTLQSVPVAYSINGGAYTLETWTGNLASGATTFFSFSNTFVAPGTDYSICAFTKKAGDIYLFNDTTCAGITATAAPNDVGVTAFLAPGDTTNPGDSIQVIIRVRNFGSNTQTVIPLGYSRNGVQIVTETWTGSLAGGDSTTYTFHQKYISPVSNYILCAYTMLSGDADASNDQTCKYPVGVVGMEEYNGDGFFLWQNIPNPTNANARIDYYLPSAGKVHFEMVDILGRSVKNLEVSGASGRNSLNLELDKLTPGVYYYSMTYDNQRLTRKLVMTR